MEIKTVTVQIFTWKSRLLLYSIFSALSRLSLQYFQCFLKTVTVQYCQCFARTLMLFCYCSWEYLYFYINVPLPHYYELLFLKAYIIEFWCCCVATHLCTYIFINALDTHTCILYTYSTKHKMKKILVLLNFLNNRL